MWVPREYYLRLRHMKGRCQVSAGGLAMAVSHLAQVSCRGGGGGTRGKTLAQPAASAKKKPSVVALYISPQTYENMLQAAPCLRTHIRWPCSSAVDQVPQSHGPGHRHHPRHTARGHGGHGDGIRRGEELYTITLPHHQA